RCRWPGGLASRARWPGWRSGRRRSPARPAMKAASLPGCSAWLYPSFRNIPLGRIDGHQQYPSIAARSLTKWTKSRLFIGADRPFVVRMRIGDDARRTFLEQRLRELPDDCRAVADAR